MTVTLLETTIDDGFPMTTDPETARWAAVQARDANADGRFVFAVTSTHIYCRPSCPSRRPLRRNARFYGTPDEAERAGFRACRRCEPRRVGPSRVEAAVSRARAHLDAKRGERVALNELAAIAGLSPFHFQRSFKAQLGVTPREYAAALRVGRLKRELRSGRTVSAATYEAGFGSGSRVYDGSDAQLGMTPATYRRGGAGAVIRFTTVSTPLGRALVAATERGLAALMLGTDDAALERSLRAEYPRADVARRNDAQLKSLAAAVRTGLTAGSGLAALPLDVAATAFQQRVWRALREIPAGETRTYADVARSIGRPSAARAVARACATNVVAVAIPCHRVVRGDGGMGGYRWGLERKRALLAGEGERAATS